MRPWSDAGRQVLRPSSEVLVLNCRFPFAEALTVVYGCPSKRNWNGRLIGETQSSQSEPGTKSVPGAIVCPRCRSFPMSAEML